MDTLSQSFYNRDTVTVARELLGAILVREYKGTVLAGIITETEAYCSIDPACHAYRGKTERNAALFGPVGHTYVYFIYGAHFCVNLVAREASMPAGGVLLRGLEPIQGIEIMQRNRDGATIKNLTNGPGKITQALGITKQDMGINATQPGPLYVMPGREVLSSEIIATPRIGISAGQDLLWRFYLKE